MLQRRGASVGGQGLGEAAASTLHAACWVCGIGSLSLILPGHASMPCSAPCGHTTLCSQGMHMLVLSMHQCCQLAEHISRDLLFAWVALQSLHSAVGAATCRGDAQSPHRSHSSYSVPTWTRTQWLTNVATCRASAPASKSSSSAPTPGTRSPSPAPAQQPKIGTAARPVQQASGDREGEASIAPIPGLVPWCPSSTYISSKASAAGKGGAHCALR